MNITDIRIRKIYADSRLRALVSITVDHDLAVHDIKIIEGPERLFVAMRLSGHLPPHHPASQKTAGGCSAQRLSAVHPPAGKSRRSTFPVTKPQSVRVENRTLCGIMFIYFLFARASAPASETTARAAARPVSCDAPVLGLPLSPPLR